MITSIELDRLTHNTILKMLSKDIDDETYLATFTSLTYSDLLAKIRADRRWVRRSTVNEALAELDITNLSEKQVESLRFIITNLFLY